MFNIKFDSPFSEQEKFHIRTACSQNQDMSAMAVRGVGAVVHNDKERTRLEEWFGSSPPLQVAERIRKMDTYISSAAKTVTFVDRRHEAERMINYKGPGVKATYGRTIPMTECDYAYVKNLSDFEDTAEAHVGSGLRMYLGERFFHPSKKTVDRARVVYHELAHKVLAIPDVIYGAGNCRQLARAQPVDAMRNADSWSFYVSSFIHQWP